MSAPYSGQFDAGTVTPAPSGTIIQNVNLFDAGSQTAAAWTKGAYQILPVPQQPTLTEQWQIQAWTVSLNLIRAPVDVTLPQYGRFGKLIGALIPNASGVTHSITGMPWQPLASIPSSAVQDPIWDPGTDPTPPTLLTAVAGAVATYPPVPLVHTFPFPSPLTLEPGQNVAMALFLTPGLLFNTNLFVTDATYSIYFDSEPSPGVTGV